MVKPKNSATAGQKSGPIAQQLREIAARYASADTVGARNRGVLAEAAANLIESDRVGSVYSLQAFKEIGYVLDEVLAPRSNPLRDIENLLEPSQYYNRPLHMSQAEWVYAKDRTQGAVSELQEMGYTVTDIAALFSFRRVLEK